jgi:hypothetical protein
MNRRTLLRGGAVAAGGGLATLAGLRLSSEEASAATTTLDVGGDQALLDGEGVLSADAITPDSGEQTTDVEVESRLRVENADGEVLADASASDSATLSIERAVELDPEEYGSVGGSGGLTVETA